jgi:ATP-dependent protease ClpP protease subunit
MPKHKLDYDLSVNRRLKKHKHEEEEVVEAEEEEEHPMMDMLGLSDSVVVRDNHIYFYCTVTKKNIVRLITSLRDVSKKLQYIRSDLGAENLKIYLHINSNGGSVFAALAAIDTIISSPIPIVSIVEGGAASAATLISVVCQERKVTPNSFMLVHQLSSGFWGKMEEIKDEFINLKKLMRTLTKIYKKHTKIDDSEETTLKSLLKRDLWLSSKECLKYGMVDVVE